MFSIFSNKEEIAERFIFYVFIVKNVILCKNANSDRPSGKLYTREEFLRLRFYDSTFFFFFFKQGNKYVNVFGKIHPCLPSFYIEGHFSNQKK